nr:putative ribonuclease H-like domain-containing protein [Tanacetum cinerariifolium]
MLVQVYVDDIIFGSTRKDWCEDFETLTQSGFEMSSMGPLTFFLGLQVDQRLDGIFIHQGKYVADILKKFDLDNFKLASTLFEPQKIREKNVPDEPISVHLYRSMIGCLMYLTATRPDIMFTVCTAARHQVTPKTSNLLSVKRIFNDYAGAHGDRKSTTGGCQFLRRRKSTTGGCQFLRRRLISWQCKKQTIVATSSCEAEYVAVASCCGQWLLVTSAGRVIFCWLIVIPAGDLGSASEVSLPDGVNGLEATIDGTSYTITEASIRSALQLDDLNAIDTLTNAEIFDGLRAIRYATEGKFTFFKNKFSPQWKFLIHTSIHCISPKSGSWNQFASNIAIALICLSTGRKYNFSNMIFNGMCHNVSSRTKFLMYPRFLQIILDTKTEDTTPYPAPLAQPQEFSPPLPSPVVEPHPLIDPMPSPPRQSSHSPIPFGPAPSSGVASTYPIPKIPSLSRPTAPTKKRKLVLSDSENEEEARQSRELDALLHLANAALHDLSASTTPSKPDNQEQSSEQEISPTTLDA